MENIDAPDVLPVILGGDIGAYSLARAFHEAYGIVPLVLSQAACHMCGDSSILVNRVVPHLERPAVLLSTLATLPSASATARCFCSAAAIGTCGSSLRTAPCWRSPSSSPTLAKIC